MAAEYTPTMDEDKALPRYPRPLTSARERLLAENMTGSQDGFAPRDPLWWYGGTTITQNALNSRVEAQIAASQAWDEFLGQDRSR